MSAGSKNHATTHAKIHTYTGWGLIIGLPFVIWSVIKAIPTEGQGIIDWLSTPHGALGFLAFLKSVILVWCRIKLRPSLSGRVLQLPSSNSHF